MKRLETVEDIKALGAVLFVAAHPDDETFTAAGILAAAARNGQRVGCVNATRGDQGVQDEVRWPQAKLAEIRTQELEDSLAVLGVKEHWWLSYLDGKCAEADEAEAVEELRKVVEEFAPDTILTFGPDGLTGHPDHKAVSRWTARVVAGSDIRVFWNVIAPDQYDQLRVTDEAANLFFATDKPPLVAGEDCAIDFRLPADLTELKRRAIEVVPSQTEKILAARPFAVPGEALARECFVAATRRP
jgi:LmbE family N-acetylglucosaminyl deacetylase